MDAKQLMEIKEIIKDAKTQHAEIKGQLKGIEEQIKNDFGVNIEDAKEFLESLNSSTENKKIEFEKNSKKIKEKMQGLDVFQEL